MADKENDSTESNNENETTREELDQFTVLQDSISVDLDAKEVRVDAFDNADENASISSRSSYGESHGNDGIVRSSVIDEITPNNTDVNEGIVSPQSSTNNTNAIANVDITDVDSGDSQHLDVTNIDPSSLIQRSINNTNSIIESDLTTTEGSIDYGGIVVSDNDSTGNSSLVNSADINTNRASIDAADNTYSLAEVSNQDTSVNDTNNTDPIAI